MKMPITYVSPCARHLGALLFISLLIFSTAPAQNPARTRRPAPAKKPGTLIFVVTGHEQERTMDPLVLIEGGQYKEPTGADPQGRDLSPFANTYLQPGQKYRLLFGGGEDGTVTVKKSSEGCNNIHADVEVETSAKIGGHVMALATNSETLGRKSVSRRAPTVAERAALMELVKRIYTQKGTNASLLRNLETQNLTATDLDGDGTFELVGSFQIGPKAGAIKGSRRDLFLIATPLGKSYKAELVEYQAYQMTEGFGRGIDFVDQLDLDGDGKAEVVTVNEGFDAYGYSIYKKQAGTWRSIFSSTGDAC